MPAFEIQDLLPLMTMDEPSRRAVVCIAAITAIGTNANSTFSKVGSTLAGTGS